LEQQILSANPVMGEKEKRWLICCLIYVMVGIEAFGNAKTMRNNNSSRFGKLITVYFAGHGLIVGGSIINYLLEKSRVVFQTEGERNYHIFYQLIAGCKEIDSLKQLTLPPPSSHHYTNQSSVSTVEGHPDNEEFHSVINAMGVLGIGEELRRDIFTIVAGVLMVGNVTFRAEAQTNADDAAKVEDEEDVRKAAELWKLSTEVYKDD